MLFLLFFFVRKIVKKIYLTMHLKKKALKNLNVSIFIMLKTIDRIKRVFQKCIHSKHSCQHWCGESHTSPWYSNED